MLLYIALVVVVLFCVRLLLDKQSRVCHLKRLPGLKPQFLIGNIGWILNIYTRKSEYHPSVYILERVLGHNVLFEKHGFHCFWIGSSPIVSVFSPHLLEVSFGLLNAPEHAENKRTQ
ncbi:hypothetical protein CEXT_275141 [Caerostris extrusa]|uniref:Cytochrome P450 n=1 Tax=Caerostris extrusa TaxID=172846 RepID=A0AAV4MSS0_CAEEX|nr:hypothetical protein CEXT_275141 [Caerostris extrusa]